MEKSPKVENDLKSTRKPIDHQDLDGLRQPSSKAFGFRLRRYIRGVSARRAAVPDGRAPAPGPIVCRPCRGLCPVVFGIRAGDVLVR